MLNARNLLSDAIKLKFPNISGLSVHSYGHRQPTVISFDSTSGYTENEIKGFVDSIKIKRAKSPNKSLYEILKENQL